MAHRFIIDDSTGALYSDFTCRRLTSAADILKSERGLSPTLEIYLVNVATDTRAVTGQTLTNADLDIILGSAGKMPDEGIIKIGWNDSGTLYESGYVDVKNLSDDAIAAAFNSAVSPVTDAEGINVDNIGEGKWLLTMKKVGAISGNPTFDVEGCNPPSAVEVSSVRTGDSDTKGQWIISIAQSPVASISGGSFSAVTSGSFSGLSASISLNTTAMIASISRGIKDFELSITHNNQLLHRSPVSIHESLDPTTAGTLIISSPSLFTLGSNAVNQGETIALSGGLTYDGTTLAAPFLPLAGGTMTGALNLGDNINAQFGDSQQLKIYHNGANNGFIENSTAYLVLESSNIILRNTAGNEDYAKFLGDGAVELYYNNSKKFETTSLGATISGKLIVNGDLDVSGTTTTFNSTVVTVDDPVFTVGGDTAPTSSDNKDRGIEFRYFRSGESAKVGFFGYSNADDAFKLLTSATNNSEVFSGTLADLNVGNVLHGDGTATAPSISFFNDSDTGFYHAGGAINVSFNTQQRWHWTSDFFRGAATLSAEISSQAGSASSPNYRFRDDNNTGIFRADADTLAFTTGGTEAARFDSDGNFGIGYNNPSHPIHVRTEKDGNYVARITNTESTAGSNYGLKVDGGSNASDISFEVANYLGDINLRVTGDGNVGIGGAPTRELEVTGTGNVYARITAPSASDSAALELNNTNLLWSLKADDTDSDAFKIINNNGTALTIDADKKVGIGGTPNELLQIDGTSPKIRLRDTDASGTPYVHFDASDGNILLSADAGNEIASSNIQFAIDGTEAARFDSSGRFAIGETTPSAYDGDADDLIVKTGGNTGITIRTSSTGKGSIFFADGISGSERYQGKIQYFHSDNSLRFATSATEAARFDSSGHFLIPDDNKIKLGDDEDLEIYHTGNSLIQNNSGAFFILNQAAEQDIIFKTVHIGDSNELLRLDGSASSINVPDNVQLNIGSGIDLIHNSTNAFLKNNVGDLYIENTANGKDTIFKNDNASGTATELLRLDGSTGNVGIGGVTSPSANLEISKQVIGEFGALRLSNTNTGVGDNVALEFKAAGLGSPAQIVGIAPGGLDVDLAFLTVDSNTRAEVMRITGNGNVGIGTTSPQKALEISEASLSGGAIMRLTSTGETSAGDVIGKIEFYNSDTTDYTPGVMSSIKAIGGPSGGEGHLQFLTNMPSEGADASTVALHLHSNANVGISTTSPRNRLDLGANGTSHLRWGTWSELGEESSHNTLVLGSNVYVDSSSTKVRSTSNDGYRAIRMKYNEGITFHTLQQSVTADDALGYERMRIDSSGNVGILTASPDTTLTVNGGVSFKVAAPNNSNHTITNTDYCVFMHSLTASRTVSIPTSERTAGRILIIKDRDGTAATHNIVIDPDSTVTIDGSSTYTISTNYQSVKLISDGSNWFVID